jgi:FKBP-type peptidyl-prolyl cis-trans isomerase SlyD
MAKNTTPASIQEGCVVNVAYTLTNSKGEVLDQATAKDPFAFIHGAQQVVPGLEKALTGLKTGDAKKITIPPADAYGEVDPSLKLTVKRTQFPPTVELKAGMQFETQTADGHGLIFTVEGVKGDSVSIDGNHPLAGQTLHFDIEVLEVRKATQEELAHGHVHGPGGHHH